MQQFQSQSQSQSQSPISAKGQASPEEASLDATSDLGLSLDDYAADPARFDELVDSDGVPRPAWKRFLESLAKIPREDFAQRWDEARGVMRENGVTYKVYGQDGDADRPWQLDPIPLLIAEREWRGIETALIQRAHLFDRLLADCFGQRRLVASGILPPDALYRNPRYYRPCVGMPLPRGRFLHLYAVDIARAKDGQWWVLSDRTQAPSGMGYALENRVVQTRMLPEAARLSRLVRLASYFRGVLEALGSAAPRRRDNPSVVLLTPGPHNETYFEHAFLARYLGIALVEGADLTVRDDHVFLKTLDGLVRVDVILRRLDEEFCDPLELMSESQIGVAGLLEAIRRNHVTVLNPPGSGLAESPALLAFLPSICRELLGEDLLMPSVATWWCGQSKEASAVVERLDKLVIRDAFGRGLQGRFPGRESKKQREQLAAAIAASPADFVAQEEVAFSTAPVWNEGRLEPRPMTLRVHLVATEDGYAVMPGGLTRFTGSSDENLLTISMQQGSGSKDTWILSEDRPPPHQSQYAATYPVELQRAAPNFPSRAADNLFWLGRYAERSESMARLLRQVLTRLTSDAGFGALPDVAPLWSALVDAGHLAAPLADQDPTQAGPRELYQAVTDAVFDDSADSNLAAVHRDLSRLATETREALSLDTWRITRRLSEALRPRPQVRRLIELVPFLDRVITQHAALSGMASENTTRTQGWLFLDLGRRLERAIYVASVASYAIAYRDEGTMSPAAYDAVLEFIDSSITYRRRHFYGPRLLPVLDLLVYDPSLPRSLAFQLERIEGHLAALPVERSRPYATEARKIVTGLLGETRTTEMAARDADEEAVILEQAAGFLSGVEGAVERISNDLTQVYFSVLGGEHSAGGAATSGIAAAP